VGIVPGSAYAFAHRIIGEYIKAHGDVSAQILRYQHDELENALLEAKLDFGFTDRRSERKEIVQSTVMNSELRFFVSNKLPKRYLREFLEEMPLVICRSERRVPSAIEEFLDSLDLTPKNVIVSEYPSLVESLCREGAGVSVLGRLHFENDPSVQMLRLPRDFPNLTEKLYVTWASYGENSEAIKRLKPFLAQSPK
jgi:DNA-binding transcriptional LysR family regulator